MTKSIQTAQGSIELTELPFTRQLFDQNEPIMLPVGSIEILRMFSTPDDTPTTFHPSLAAGNGKELTEMVEDWGEILGTLVRYASGASGGDPSQILAALLRHLSIDKVPCNCRAVGRFTSITEQWKNHGASATR